MATMGEVPWVEVRSLGICLKMVLSVKVMRETQYDGMCKDRL
jgi:hypothetical protein